MSSEKTVGLVPGKEPLNPEHDIFLFGEVAIKTTFDGKSFLSDNARVERIEWTTDGTEVLSFKLKDDSPVRVRCSVYDRDDDGYYEVGEGIVLTLWRSPRGILGTVQLLPLLDGFSKYRLHETSRSRLENLDFHPYGERPSIVASENSDQFEEASELDEGFYEVEDVLERRLPK